MVELEVVAGDPSVGEVFTAVACKAAGGKWNGGHDISGHVFLLVLGTSFLMQEIGWTVRRWKSSSARQAEERCILMADGALKSANVEAEMTPGQGEGSYSLGVGGKTALAIMGLNLWMLLMTAIYFHTWFEKVSSTNDDHRANLLREDWTLTSRQLTGLLTAFIGVYAVYIVPRWLPVLRGVLGLPGI